ncbi:MAG: DUF3795 domain-containing protein [Anaerolineae bacterium]
MKVLGCCGLECGACEAYLATQANDREALEAVAAKWSKMYNAEMAADSLWCDGCTSRTRVAGGWPEKCPVRNCALGRGLANCGACPDYGCATMEQFIGGSAESRANFEAMRPH